MARGRPADKLTDEVKGFIVAIRDQTPRKSAKKIQDDIAGYLRVKLGRKNPKWN